MTLYHYVGPAEIKARVAGRLAGTRISSAADLLDWARGTVQLPRPDGLVAATFVIDANGDLLLADRRCEHVACAGGGPVLSAGEMFFLVEGGGIALAEASNQSTGFCPEPSSWPSVASALERIGVAHPGRFTFEVVFRLCTACSERNIVKDGWFVCGVCGGRGTSGSQKATRMVNESGGLSGKVLEAWVVAAPCDAGFVKRDDLDRGVEVTAEEIEVRKASGDYETPRPGRETEMCYNQCPVCGFGPDEPAWDDAGPGGADGRKRAHPALLERWVAGGMAWWGDATREPACWDAQDQPRRLGRSDRE